MSAAAIAEIFAAFDTRKSGSVSAEDATEIASVFGPFPAPVSFAADDTFTTDDIVKEIERASEGDAKLRATAVFTAAFGADAKADEASLAALCTRVTSEADSSASALRVLATFNARRVAVTEFVTLDEAARVEVPSRSKRALVTKRGPKKDSVVSQAAKDRHTAIDAAFSAVGAWESPAELDSAVAQWVWEGGFAEAGDAAGVVARCGTKIQNIPAPKAELPDGACSVFKVQRNSAGHIWLTEGADIATVADDGVLTWAPKGDTEPATFTVRKCDTGVRFLAAEKALTSSGALVAEAEGTSFTPLPDVAARVNKDDAEKLANGQPADDEATPAEETKAAEEEKPAAEETKAAEEEKPAAEETKAAEEEKPTEES